MSSVTSNGSWQQSKWRVSESAVASVPQKRLHNNHGILCFTSRNRCFHGWDFDAEPCRMVQARQALSSSRSQGERPWQSCCIPCKARTGGWGKNRRNSMGIEILCFPSEIPCFYHQEIWAIWQVLFPCHLFKFVDVPWLISHFQLMVVRNSDKYQNMGFKMALTLKHKGVNLI